MLLKDTLHQLRGKQENIQDPAKGKTDAKQTQGDCPVIIQGKQQKYYTNKNSMLDGLDANIYVIIIK